MAGRPSEQVEMRLVSEWLQLHRRDFWYQLRVRLGPLPNDTRADQLTDAEQRLVHGAFARWADAIVELPDRTELVEAKIVAHPSAIGQLDLYAELLPQTPGLSHRKQLPVEKVLLYAVPDPHVIAMAARQNVRTVQYTAPWIDEYLSRQAARKRTAPRAQFGEVAAT